MQEKGLEELVLPKDLLATVTVRCDFISNLDTTKELVRGHNCRRQNKVCNKWKKVNFIPHSPSPGYTILYLLQPLVVTLSSIIFNLLIILYACVHHVIFIP